MPVSAVRAGFRATRRRVRSDPPQVEALEGRTLAASGAWSAALAQHGRTSARHGSPATAEVSARARGPVGASQGTRALMNVVYMNQGGRREQLDLYLPGGPTPPGGRPVILALPGGGWRWVRRGDLGGAVSSFAKDGYVVAVADYAFSTGLPGSKVWPTNFQDVRRAVQWLRSNADKYGIDPSRVAVWGESAGGHLASLLGAYPQGLGVSTLSPPTRVQAVIDFYGPADLTTLYDSSKARPYLATFLGGSPAQFPERYQDASPVAHVTPDAPPFLIFQGTTDTAVPSSQSAKLDATLTAAGVPHHTEFLKGLGHGFRLDFGKNGSLRPKVLAFLDAALNHGGRGIV